MAGVVVVEGGVGRVVGVAVAVVAEVGGGVVRVQI